MCVLNPPPGTQIQGDTTCSDSQAILSSRANVNSKQCHIDCFNEPLCVWMQFTDTDNVCELVGAGCTASTLVGTKSYRPSDFIKPPTTANTCVHKETHGRISSIRTKCSDFGSNTASCNADTDCQFNPEVFDAAIPVLGADTADCHNGESPEETMS
jgi:hypothetical protein